MIKEVFQEVKMLVEKDMISEDELSRLIGIFYESEDLQTMVRAFVSIEAVIVASELICIKVDEPNVLAGKWNRAEPIFRAIMVESIMADDMQLEDLLAPARKELIKTF